MKKNIFALCYTLVALVAFTGFSTYNAPKKSAKSPKNIILMIGDGMGLTQITAGMYSTTSALALEQFTHTGLIKTQSSSHLITDSASGATAFSCGCKTYNGAIGVNRKGVPCKTILERLDSLGYATGLVATSSITHATPASFMAHEGTRADMEPIASDFLETDFDLIIGGGRKYFDQRTTDTRNLCQELKTKGYSVYNLQEWPIDTVQPDPKWPLALFTSDGEPGSWAQGRTYLPVATTFSTRFLERRSKNGFFLMVEGSQIDWACHANDAARAVSEMLDFDAAVKEVLNFAKADGNTLVIVTADHETGGMVIEHGSLTDSLSIAFNSGKHTASLIPVFAYGPGAEHFMGIYENTEIHTKIASFFGW